MMRKLLLIPVVLASFIATTSFAQTTRPMLSQLDAEMRSLYGQIAAGTVRVQVPVPTMARLMASDGHPIHKWSELVDAAVWERLQQLAATRPAEGVRGDGRAAELGESRQIEYLDEAAGNTNRNKMIAVLPS